jgi:hypothetical protein
MEVSGWLDGPAALLPEREHLVMTFHILEKKNERILVPSGDYNVG